MFKKFSKDSVSGQNPVKQSVQRGIRNKILEQYPTLEPYFEDILPKKNPMTIAKCANHVTCIVENKEIIFFQIEKDGVFYPTLRLLQKYPFILTKVQVDVGAIKFVLSGANIMCPGLTSKGGKLEENFEPGTVLAIFAEGKEHPLAIGLAKMSRDDIKKINKDIGIDNIHCLDDGLWNIGDLE